MHRVCRQACQDFILEDAPTCHLYLPRFINNSLALLMSLNLFRPLMLREISLVSLHSIARAPQPFNTHATHVHTY